MTMPEKTRWASESWRDVDKSDDAALFVADLDRNADTLREARLDVIRLLEVRTGPRCWMWGRERASS